MRLLVILILFIFSACTPTPKSKNALRLNIGSEPTSLDPGKVRDLQGVTLTTALFEGLTRVNSRGEPEMALASHVDISENGLVYTFHLRAAQWTNTTSLTAHDFVYSWQRALDPHFPSDLAYLFYDIQNAKSIKKGEMALGELAVQALSDDTLEVTLEKRNPHFLELVARPPFLPISQEHDKQVPTWATHLASYVSNGPFRLHSWDPHNLIVLEKNPLYWDHAAVSLNQVHLFMVGDENTELQMFERGEIDWAGSPLSTISLSAIPDLQKKNLLHVRPLCGTAFIRVNTQKAPLNQAKVRRALSGALKRKEILEAVTYGTQIPALCLTPPQFHLLKALPIPHESLSDLPDITLTYPMGERLHLIAQALQHEWKEAFGIHVKLEGVESKVYFTKLRHKDYELILGSLIADYLDPLHLLQVLEHPQLSDTHWEEPHYSHLLECARGSTSRAERVEWLSQAETFLLSEMPIIPLFHYNMLYLKSEKLKNISLSPLGILDFKYGEFIDL